MKQFDIIIIGAGLAGCEAAYQATKRGLKVKLVEMRPEKMTEAHTGGNFAELVCSNSLKAEAMNTGSGLLKLEMQKYDSLLIKCAYQSQVPAGGALAVDREKFSALVEDYIKNHPDITIEYGEVTEIDEGVPTIIATGPLTSDTFATYLKDKLGGALYFADAISPILDADTIDYSKGYFLGRYNKGGDDYFNIPLTEDEYNAFYDALISADVAEFHDFEKIDFFEGCMPVEVMASRGRQTLSFGPMKPVGLEHPETGERPYAVMQLRKENIEGTAFNIVGFQTKMTISAQQKVFRMLPALANVEFLRYGSVHRNTYIEAPKHLNRYYQFKNMKNIFMAGQVTGIEGYIESIASGMIAGMQMSCYIKGEPFIEIPQNTALGALSYYVSGESGLAHATADDYVPSNFHFGMLKPLEKKIRKKSEKKEAQAKIALELVDEFLANK